MDFWNLSLRKAPGSMGTEWGHGKEAEAQGHSGTGWGILTSIRSMRMGSASCKVMTSGDCTVAKVLSGRIGKSYRVYCF